MSAKVDAFEGTSRAHTAEPRWSTERPQIDAGARRHVIIAGGDAQARAAAAVWLDEVAAAGATADVIDADDAAAISAAVAQATAATRFLAAGNEAELSAAVSRATLGGVAPKELRTVLTDPAGPRPVQCVHCRQLTHTTAQVEETCTCESCGVPLLVFPHYSRRIGAYLGFRVDAEEMP